MFSGPVSIVHCISYFLVLYPLCIAYHVFWSCIHCALHIIFSGFISTVHCISSSVAFLFNKAALHFTVSGHVVHVLHIMHCVPFFSSFTSFLHKLHYTSWLFIVCPPVLHNPALYSIAFLWSSTPFYTRLDCRSWLLVLYLPLFQKCCILYDVF